MGRAQSSSGKRSADLVYERIRGDISSGRFAPGVHLGETTLAERFGVSRTPIRAALSRLEADGFITIAPHVGAIVPKRTVQELSETFEVRAILESEAAGLTALRRTAEQVQTMRQIVEKMEQLLTRRADVSELSTLNKAFHEIILEATGNPTLAQSAERLMGIGFSMHTYTRFSTGEIERSLIDHRNILMAIETGDSLWANAAMKNHILGASNVIRSRTKQDIAA